MELLLVVATLAVGVAVLYVTATLRTRTRQNTAPLIDGATRQLAGQIEATSAELRRQLQQIADELQRDQEDSRLEERKIQGRLDHADSRITSMASQFMAELDTIRRLGEQIGARQDQLGGDLRQLDHQVAQLTEATMVFSPSGHTAEEAAAGGTPVVPSRFYAERLRFSTVRIPPEFYPGAEGQFRIQIERYVGELPNPQLGDLSDTSAIIYRAENDEAFREQLGRAASGYLAAKGADPVFAVATERWITQNTFPETAAAQVCNRIGNGLGIIVEKSPEKTGTQVLLPGLEAPASDGTGSVLILRPVTEATEPLTTFLEVTGVVVGRATGLQPLALAAAKMLAHDELHDLLARGLRNAARRVFEGQEAPADIPGSARPVDASFDSPSARSARDQAWGNGG
jgi:hypothetical protein